MTLLSLSNVERSFGDLLVFENVGLRIDEKDHIGIVGDNGAGKTTLIKILTGEEPPDRGERATRKDLSIGWAAQIPQLGSESTVREATERSLEELDRMEQELREIEEQLSKTPEDESLLHRHEYLHTRFESAGGYRRHQFVEQALTGLGFHMEDFDKPVSVLSGGEKSRVALARLMLLPCDLLILDEPTNHLDLEGIEFLENWLQQRDGAFVVVSHDRRFLDRVCKSIVEVEGGQVTRYRGNFAAYRKQKELDLETTLREHKKQEEFFEKEMAYIRKHMGGRWTAQAKGRLKRLERMERIARPSEYKRHMSLRLGKARGLEGQTMVEAHDLGFAFPNGKRLFQQLEFRVYFGERIGIVGKNGVGKSTLLKCIEGQMLPTEGTLTRAQKIRHLYFTQQMEDLPSSGSVLQALLGVVPTWTEGELRSHLARFLFSEDEVDKEVSTLSGGEKRRLCLARLVTQEADVLLLDEPTNHLDITTRETLEEAIEDYPGTVIAISHDRFFLDRIGGRVFELQPDCVVVHEMGLEAYESALLERRRQQSAEARAEKTERARERSAEAKAQAASQQQGGEQKIRNPFAFKKLEEKIFALESELEDVQAGLADPEAWTAPERMKTLNARQDEINAELEGLYEQWENWQ
jgi:ATP-binding cassette subfamily F protein 3